MSTKILLLSEAIREGSKYGPQIFGTWNGGAGSTCALGAAYLAVGYAGPVTRVPKQFKVYENRVSDCPVFHCKKEGLITDIVMHLNDHHRVTREEIANWVEREEIVRGWVDEVKTVAAAWSSLLNPTFEPPVVKEPEVQAVPDDYDHGLAEEIRAAAKKAREKEEVLA